MSLPDMGPNMGGSQSLLPHANHSQNFQFTTSNLGAREPPPQRNYVFVDEHNRHKRLKVMRACEGCRRRKIKCDAATTNSWPCAACTRLKLSCVPPTVSYETDSSQSGAHAFELQRDEYPAMNLNAYPRPQPMQQHHYAGVPTHMQADVPSQTYEPLASYAGPSYVTPEPSNEAIQYGGIPSTTLANQELSYHTGYTSHPVQASRQEPLDQAWRPDVHSLQRAASLDSSAWARASVDVGVEMDTLRQNSLPSAVQTEDALTEAMGLLKVDHLAVASYIADRNKLADAPALAEYEIELPQTVSPDARLRIPPEMMPSDEQALQYFQYYFSNIHPYVPVLNRQSFYQHWASDRDSISPLLLEAIFACTTMTLQDHAQGSKWLALATRHEDSFKDVPRMSTLQAQLILLKARESAPKRGYFYRSWMSISNLIMMAKDLDLHNHKAIHDTQQLCGSRPIECTVKARVWQTLYALETMIGGPQGRKDFAADPETVEFNPPVRMQGIEESEYQVSFQFIYFVRLIRNIRGTILAYKNVQTTQNWYTDPEFVGHDQAFSRYLQELPRSLLVEFPDDGSTPHLRNSFIANMNSYHYLSVIMHHRPQIHYRTATDGQWRQHMSICHDSAKKMCRIQEGILENFGMPGMLCMQRGISFTVYCVLTCTMLHLAAICSPDTDLNADARDYFVRHMRILEQSSPHWPLPEVQAQINSLREAFSADTSKPFALKPSFPIGSPNTQHASPSIDGAYNHQHHLSLVSASVTPSVTASASTRLPTTAGLGVPISTGLPTQVIYQAAAVQHPITPPISTTDEAPKADSPAVPPGMMMAAQGQQNLHGQDDFNHQWNPTKIFDQWNVAFGTPASSTTSQPSPPVVQRQVPSYEIQSHPDSAHYTQATPQTTYPSQESHMQMPTNSHPQRIINYPAPPSNAYVSPSMWQEVVANSLADGRKRMWDYGGTQDASMDPMNKRQR